VIGSAVRAQLATTVGAGYKLHMLPLHLAWFAWGVLLGPLLAQATAPTKAVRTEQQVDQEIARILVGYAKMAESYKAHGEARRIYDQILDHYDLENGQARTGLGWRRVKGEWQQTVADADLPKDAATPAQKKQLSAAWEAACKRVGGLHRDLGLQLLAAAERPRATAQLERALVFLPDDRAVHDGLGHQEFDGFRGTAEQIAFVQRMRAILALGKRLRAQPVEVQPVDAAQMPETLRRTGIAFAGARSSCLTYWVADSQEEAMNCAAANARAELLWRELLATDPAQDRLRLCPTQWLVVLRNPEQRKRLLEVSPECLGNKPMDQALLVGGTTFHVGGVRAEWVFQYAAGDADHAVGQFTKRGTEGLNSALTEGLVHCATWLLCDSMMSSYIQLAHTGGGAEAPPTAPAEWFRRLQADIDLGQDWPLRQVPREGFQNFRESVRLKAWSFVLWLIARHPDRWVQLLGAMQGERIAEAAVDQAFESVLGRGVGEVEAEWRAFARRGSRIAKAAGLPH
jgi:hypothetical protein